MHKDVIGRRHYAWMTLDVFYSRVVKISIEGMKDSVISGICWVGANSRNAWQVKKKEVRIFIWLVSIKNH